MMPDDDSGAATPAGPVRVIPLTAEASFALCQLAASLDLDHQRIDLAGCGSKEEFLRRVADALDFPEWFGGNWDAFYDCLADLSWRPARGYVLVLENPDRMRRVAPESLDTALAILGDAAAYWAGRGIPFRAFVGAAAISD